MSQVLAVTQYTVVRLLLVWFLLERPLSTGTPSRVSSVTLAPSMSTWVR